MTDAFLEKAKKALLNKGQKLTLLDAVTLTVPPVPMGAMGKLCDLSQVWDSLDLTDNGDDTSKFVAKIQPVIDDLAEVLYLTVAQCDEEVSLQGLKLLINLSNFHTVLAALMYAAGLLSPQVTVADAIEKAEKAPVKKPKSSGRTGKK